MRHLLSLVMIVVALGVNGVSAHADDWALCRDNSHGPQQVVAACSRIIASKRANQNVLSSALNLRGLAYDWLRDYDRAFADFNEAIRVNPRYASPYNNRGLGYERKGDVDRAIADYGESIRLDPSSPVESLRAYRNRGTAYERKKDYDRAIADYSEIIRRDPKFSYALTYRARSYERMGDNDRAVADYDQAIRLDLSAFNFGERAEFYQRKGDLDRAIADFSEAIRLWPEHADGFKNRAVTYERKGDLDRAIADYSEAIRLDPKNPVRFERRAAAYERKGDNDRAMADYTEAIRLDPKNYVRYRNRAWAYGKSRDYDRVIADFSEAIKLNPDTSFGRGYFYSVKGDHERAIADFSEAIRRKATSGLRALQLAYRGLSYDATGDRERAVGDYDAAILINAIDAEGFFSHGLAQSGKGDYNRAIDAFSECIRISPGWRAAALMRRGLAYEAKGQLERAKADFEAAVATDNPEGLPEDTDKAREHLAALAAQSAGAATASATSPAARQSEALTPVVTTAEHRVALVIGNDRYPNLPADKQLEKAANDARAVGEALGRLGFRVIIGTNLGRRV
jgi:tetratricopeptide (TPR) repeat protein